MKRKILLIFALLNLFNEVGYSAPLGGDEEIHSLGTTLLKSPNLIDEEVIEKAVSSLDLDPKQVLLRTSAIHSQAALLFSEEMSQGVKNEIIEACLALSPEQIDALASHRSFFLSEETLGHNKTVIQACRSLTPLQIGVVGPVLLHRSMPVDDRVNIIRDCVFLGCEQTRLKTNVIGAFQFPEHMDNYYRAEIIKVFLKLSVEKIETLTSHKFLFNWEKMRILKNICRKSDQYRRILEACATLKSAQIEAVGKSLFLLYPEKRRRGDLWDIATQCQELTPEEIISRAKAIHSQASLLFSKDMGKRDRIEIIRRCFTLTSEQIYNLIDKEIIKKAVGPLFREDDVGTWYINRYILPICQPLSLEELEARRSALNESTSLLFFGRMDDDNRGSLIEASLRLDAEQLRLRARAIHDHAALLLKYISDQAAQRELIQACLSLSPEQIEALASHRTFFLREKRYGHGNSCAIKACKELTVAQINDIGAVGLVLLPLNINAVNRLHVRIIKKYVELGAEQTRLKANAIGAFQFPKYVDDAHRAQIIESLLELTVEQIEALVSHSSLFIWQQMEASESSKIIKTCAKLNAAQIAAIETSFSLLYPEKKQAENVVSIIALCQKLNPEEIISRAKAIHTQASLLFTERMSELDRKEVVQECFTLTPEQIVAFASQNSLFLPEKMRVLRIRDLIEAYTELAPTQIEAMGELSSFLLSSEMIEHYEFREIITTCRTLTPEQIKDRTKALLDNYSLLVLGSMDTSKHLNIVRGCLKLSPDKIRAIALHAGSLLHHCSPDFGAFKHLTIEQIEAVGVTAPHLFLNEMDLYGYRVILMACCQLTPEQIQSRARAIHDHAALLFKEIRSKEECKEIIEEIRNENARREIIKGCLALTPEKIEALALNNVSLLLPAQMSYRFDEIIKVYAELTPAQIEAIGVAGSVLLHGENNVDDHIHILQMCAKLEIEQIRLKANAIRTFQFPEQMDDYYRTQIIRSLLKLSVEQIETLSLHRSLFFWEGENSYGNSDKIDACAKLSSAQLAAVDESFSLLYPKKKIARNLVKIISLCQELTPQQIQSRAEAIHNNPSLFPSQIKGTSQRSSIIFACFKLTPDQIKTVALHERSLFLREISVYNRSSRIEACANLTVDKIKAVGESAALLLIEGMEQEAYATIISECDELSVDQIKALASQASKFFFKKTHKYECRDIVRACRALTTDQICAIGEGSTYFLKHFGKPETMLNHYRNSCPATIRGHAARYQDRA